MAWMYKVAVTKRMVQEGSCGLVLIIYCFHFHRLLIFAYSCLILQVVATRGAHLLGLCPFEFLWLLALSSGFAGAASD